MIEWIRRNGRELALLPFVLGAAAMPFTEGIRAFGIAMCFAAPALIGFLALARKPDPDE